MSLPLYEDGCIKPNIQVQTYLITYGPRCAHRKLLGATITLRETSPENAWRHAEIYFKFPNLKIEKVQLVIE